MKTVRVGSGIRSLITGIFSVTVVPFIRKDMGERYLSWLNLYFGYSFLGIYILVGGAGGHLCLGIAPRN